MRCWSAAAMLVIATFLGGSSGAAQEKSDVTLKIVKYDGLKSAVQQNRGKVVLIDFWGEF